jgi:hypothetical protein
MHPAPTGFRPMRRRLQFFALVLVLAGCSQADELPAETRACAARLYPNYNAKDFEQCVAVCIACKNGVMTTCSTACKLKGAQ